MTGLDIQNIAPTNSKENIKALLHWPFVKDVQRLPVSSHQCVNNAESVPMHDFVMYSIVWFTKQLHAAAFPPWILKTTLHHKLDTIIHTVVCGKDCHRWENSRAFVWWKIWPRPLWYITRMWRVGANHAIYIYAKQRPLPIRGAITTRFCVNCSCLCDVDLEMQHILQRHIWYYYIFIIYCDHIITRQVIEINGNFQNCIVCLIGLMTAFSDRRSTMRKWGSYNFIVVVWLICW